MSQRAIQGWRWTQTFTFTTRAVIRLTQRELREALGWGDFALRRHLARLFELEYVQVDRGPGNRRRYKLLDPDQQAPFLLGLSDPASG